MNNRIKIGVLIIMVLSISFLTACDDFVPGDALQCQKGCDHAFTVLDEYYPEQFDNPGYITECKELCVVDF